MSTGPVHVEPETAALVEFLDAQRDSVLAIVAGLDADALGARVLPSGWTPLGLVEHLGHAERHWFGEVATGSAPELPWPQDTGLDDGSDDGDGQPFTTDRSAAEVFAFYRDQCARSNALLVATPLSTPPLGQHLWQGVPDDVPDLRWIALHVLEETARHAGHLDVVRELLDGRTGLGPR